MIPVDPYGRAAAPAPTEPTFEESVAVEYRSMPPKTSIPLAVELDVRGRGRPLPFPLDDDVSE